MKKKPEQSNTDAVFRQLADRYVEAQGARLRQELEQAGSAAAPVRQLDPRITALRRRRVLAGVSAMAACLLLVLALPRFIGRDTVPSASSAESGSADDTPIAFTATLPRNLSVSRTRQDRGQTIYYLADTRGDDVVMTLQREPLPDTAGMTLQRLHGRPVYTLEKAEYALLLFRLDGISYTLTCRYELDTLMEAADAILLSAGK